MRKLTAGLLACGLALAGCSGPKSATIPSDPSKWDALADDVKKLSEDDKGLFGRYVMRMTLGNALSGKSSTIPPGTTIGEAIKAQKEFEANQAVEEGKAAALKAKLEGERQAQVAKLRQAATVAVTNVFVLPKDYDASRFNPSLQLVIGVANHTAKAISGVKGVTVFRDQFGAEISKISLSLDEDIAPNSQRSIGGYGRDLNEFMDDDKKLAVTPFEKMKVSFEPQMIVFADGSKLEAPEAAE